MTNPNKTPHSSSKIASLDEARAFFAANPDVDAVDIIFTNMSGVPRGKRLRQHEVLAVYESGRFLPGSVLVIDITGRDTEETGLVWEDGDADRYCLPVPGTLVRAPWLGENAGQFTTSFYELDHTPSDLDPRHVLGRVVDRLEAIGHWNKGLKHFQSGDYKKAREAWKECVAKDAGNLDCSTGLRRIQTSYGGGL